MYTLPRAMDAAVSWTNPHHACTPSRTWRDVPGCTSTQHVSVAPIRSALHAAWNDYILPPHMTLSQGELADRILDTRRTRTFIDALGSTIPPVQYMQLDVPCRPIDTRAAPPRLRQAVLGVAVLQQVVAVSDAAWHVPDVYFNARACTLLHEPCAACACKLQWKTPGTTPGIGVDTDDASVAWSKAAFGLKSRAMCCSPLHLGDVLYVPQNVLVPHMRHPLLYVGGGLVVHMTHTRKGEGGGNGLVSIVPLLRQRGGSQKPIRFGPPGSPLVRYTRIRRAVQCLGMWQYHVRDANCEHFMTDICGQPRMSRALTQGASVVFPLVLLILVGIVLCTCVGERRCVNRTVPNAPAVCPPPNGRAPHWGARR